MKKMLMLTSVASMIDQFNMSNIEILLKLGYEVHVAANFLDGNTSSKERVDEFKKELKEHGVFYYQIDFVRNINKIASNLKAYMQVKNLMLNNQYEFIHCQSPIGGICGRIAGKKIGVKVIYTAHGFHFFKGAPIFNWLLYYPAEKWLARFTDVLITINKEDYAIAQKFKAGKIVYVPGVGIDIEKFKNIEVNIQEKRKSIGINEDDFMVISVGELNKNKNHQVIIRAVARLKNQKIKYVLCGQGQLENKLKELAKKLGIENQVKFLGFRKDIPELLHISDLFAFPSFREGLSVALMEAMAVGLPIVCSKIRGNTDLIEDGKGGYLVESNNNRELSVKIRELIIRDDLRSKFALFNQKKINSYSFLNVINSLKLIYKDELDE